MKRFLVVGCGGSGGAVLAYLMDQLRSDLAGMRQDGTAATAALPAGWQFVHVDVPLSPDSPPDGLGSVRSQGGSYVATGPQTGSYATLDHALSQQLLGRQALGSIGTWAPRDPSKVTTPPSVGAGQYRSVGRMITLNRATEVLSGLERAWEHLFRVETLSEMGRLSVEVPSLGEFDPADRPIVLVVSSMAGGAGASMALDVCRLISLVRGVSPELMGVFMVGADVFDTLPAAARGGVRPNALAMLGEIVAAQSGAARRHDVGLMAALGHQAGEGVEVPFARVFPVGRFIGADKTMIGDGSPKAVYRGLGRGLAALMSSATATDQFVSSDLGNTGSPVGDRRVFGWGPSRDNLAWGAFGYAALSMGRDRYAEYAAQRMARAAVDHLLDGHLSPDSTASGNVQVNVLVDSQWAHVLSRLGLPATPQDPREHRNAVGRWFMGEAPGVGGLEAMAQSVVETNVTPTVPGADGVNAAQWLSSVRGQLRNSGPSVVAGVNQEAYRWVHEWHTGLFDRTVAVVEEAVSRHGLPYANELLSRTRSHVETLLVPVLQEFGSQPLGDVVAVPSTVERVVASAKGVISAGQQIVQNLLSGVRLQVHDHLFAGGAGLASRVLSGYVVDVLAPLSDAIGEAQRLLEQAKVTPDPDLGLARLTTDHYPGWPTDGDGLPPARFSHADNEVLLTSSEVFPQRYEADVRAAWAADNDDTTAPFAESRTQLVTQVVGGRWRTTGGTQPPGGLVELRVAWRARAFPTDPGTGTPLVPSQARFTLHVRPAELLERARSFVARPSESFHQFTRVSLKGYVGPDVLESERAGRVREIVSKFVQVLALARPLAAVNSDAVMALHGKPLAYRYKFSELPFAADRELPGLLEAELERFLGVDESSLDNLRRSLTGKDDNVTRVDVFGSYMNYSPLVFEGVLRPVAEQWGATPVHGLEDFWKWRRSRPLDAALPMSDDERRAMVAGWFVAQVLGDLRIPPEPFTEPVTIYDRGQDRWLPFPSPMLTPPTSEAFAPFDWLPAVLESVLLAYTRCHEPPVMASLRPYAVLRGTFDSGDFGPTTGQATLEGGRRLRAWLREGRSPSGGVSRVPGAAQATTPQQRQELARTWLAVPRDLASEHFMRPGQDGAAGGGSYSTIDSRRQASTTPMFRDLAPDVRWACDAVIALLDTTDDGDAGGLHPDLPQVQF